MFLTRSLLARSVWKGPNIVPLPIVRQNPNSLTKPPPIRTMARGATILPNFVGLRFQIHNGIVYHEITVTEEMVGKKLGEFSP
ncbi:MAG: mitochondrial ribosomal small subunit component [Cirrosporium novae-zelandiae]|nr:MAG: mitochondrial ribosomal small subunit component [Cirrosporium novae-zelandiae]